MVCSAPLYIPVHIPNINDPRLQILLFNLLNKVKGHITNEMPNAIFPHNKYQTHVNVTRQTVIIHTKLFYFWTFT